MRYTKPPLTFAEQADLLISRGMMGDRDVMISRLNSVNYYRLSGYWHPFRESGEEFRPGTSFEDVWARYVFDRQLRLLTMDAVERVEIALRTWLAYHHSRAYGPFGYATEPATLSKLSGPAYARFIECIKDEADRSREVFVSHFRDKYGDSHEFLPVWAATEVMAFGTVLTFFRGTTNRVKNLVASELSVPPAVLVSWVLALGAVRNICAHHSRLWNRVLGVKPLIPRSADYPDWHRPVAIDNARVFAILTICQYCMKRVAPQSRWRMRLQGFLSESASIPLAEMGFPSDWEASPIWTE
jgi:abortive infection bacteriophage resistance protein